MEVLTAGESHGSAIILLINGFPAGVDVDLSFLHSEMAKRKIGHGRSSRMVFEADSFDIESGVINGKTTGAPICVRICNKQGKPFFDRRVEESFYPRAGHSDFVSTEKYDYDSLLIAAERASARETVALVCAGGFLKTFLLKFGISVSSEVVEIGGVPFIEIDFDKMRASAKEKGTLGGVVKIVIKDSLPGVGSYTEWNQKLDAMIAARILSIQSVKGISFGLPEIFRKQGLDSLDLFNSDFSRATNSMGGIEGGISNGEEIVFYVNFKPIPTQPFPIDSYNYLNSEKGHAPVVRSDLWAIEAGAKVCEAAALIPYTDLFLKKFGSDTLKDIKNSFDAYVDRIKWKKNV